MLESALLEQAFAAYFREDMDSPEQAWGDAYTLRVYADAADPTTGYFVS